MARTELKISLIREAGLQGIAKRRLFVDEAYAEAMETFQLYKQDMLSEFDEHEITQEINNGASASNISDTLEVSEEGGNLFSFIGFEAGSDPIGELREALEQNTTLFKTARSARYGKSKIDYTFPVFAPLVEAELANAAPAPFDSSKSWILMVEGRGFSDINGLVAKYYYRARGFAESRSGTAIQVENALGGYSFKPRAYLTEIIKNFKAKF